MSKIFVSQATLKLSRNRPHRTLERKIDNPNGSLQSSKILCEHNDYCSVRKVLGREKCYIEHTKS